MKPVLSETDYRALESALASKTTRYAAFLKTLIKKFRLVKDHQVDGKTVRINSVVTFWHSLLKKVIRMRIVMPSLADLSGKKLFAFAPVSLALLGWKENDRVQMRSPGITKEFRIISVVNE